jgi:hypothetical protein
MCPFSSPEFDSNRRLNLLPPGMAGRLLFRRHPGISFRGALPPQPFIPPLGLLNFDLSKFVLCGPPPEILKTGIPKSYGCDGAEEW